VLVSISAILLVSSFTRSSSAATGATIFVTTTDQKISSSGGCSLQEAIYSSNFHSNIAIDATDPDHFITTQGVAGTGNDTIVLPNGGVFNLGTFLDGDAYNPYGPTATPIIFASITIEGYGATLQWTGSGNVRLFAVGTATISTPNGTASGTGSLTLKNVYVKNFHVKGGDGFGGGGGGLGAGGAIFLKDGTLTVENSTFDSNYATGGSAYLWYGPDQVLRTSGGGGGAGGGGAGGGGGGGSGNSDNGGSGGNGGVGGGGGGGPGGGGNGGFGGGGGGGGKGYYDDNGSIGVTVKGSSGSGGSFGG